jgi:alpha-beta hydrolase superfamily lysophospholipase
MKHTEGGFKGHNGFDLYYQRWLPNTVPIAVLVIVHGLAEHSGRYMNLINYFVPKGYAVYGFDTRGHGKSPGLRCYVEHFAYFVKDLDIFLAVVRSCHHNVRVFIIGHSVGGTITTAYAVHYQDKFDGLILSGPTLNISDSVSSALIIFARLLSLLFPKIGLYTIDAAAISRDKNVVNAYINDCLVYRGKISARLGIEIIKAMQTLPNQMRNINLPVLIMQGTADRLSDPKGSKMLYELVNSQDKTLKLYEGFYHEIFNELGHKQVFADIDAWLTRHQ